MTARWDPTGTVVVGLRADEDVIATLTAAGGDSNPKRVSGGEPKIPPPHVVVVPTGVNPQPFGLGSRRLGLARYQYAFRCVAPAALENGQANAEGGAQAASIAGAVANYLNRNGWVSRAVGGAVYATVASAEDSTAGATNDPDTKDPFVLVTGSLVATAQAVG